MDRNRPKWEMGERSEVQISVFSLTGAPPQIILGAKRREKARKAVERRGAESLSAKAGPKKTKVELGRVRSGSVELRVELLNVAQSDRYSVPNPIRPRRRLYHFEAFSPRPPFRES